MIELRDLEASTSKDERFMLDPPKVPIGFMLNWFFSQGGKSKNSQYQSECIACILASMPCGWVIGYNKNNIPLDDLEPEKMLGLNSTEIGQARGLIMQGYKDEYQAFWMRGLFE